MLFRTHQITDDGRGGGKGVFWDDRESVEGYRGILYKPNINDKISIILVEGIIITISKIIVHAIGLQWCIIFRSLENIHK
jgi:hypothetical protein